MQHTLDDLLNLGAFSCTQDVLVQYAAVNKYGRSSRWSATTEIDVYGGERNAHVCVCVICEGKGVIQGGREGESACGGIEK